MVTTTRRENYKPRDFAHIFWSNLASEAFENLFQPTQSSFFLDLSRRLLTGFDMLTGLTFPWRASAAVAGVSKQARGPSVGRQLGQRFAFALLSPAQPLSELSSLSTRTLNCLALGSPGRVLHAALET